MKTVFYLLILSLIVFQGCHFGTSTTWKNDEIPSELRSEIAEIDKKLVKCVYSNDAAGMKALMSDELVKQTADNIDSLIAQVCALIDSKKYRIIDQFYTKTSVNTMNKIGSGDTDNDSYIIEYLALNNEVFVSLLALSGRHDEILATCIYGKYPDGWKLNILQFGQYTINHMTAPQLYFKAKEQYNNGYLVDAANNMFLCSVVSKPGNEFWQYKNVKEMKDFHEKIVSEIQNQYVFPLTIEEVSTKPQILDIGLQDIEEGFFPMINYLTTIRLEDTLSTKAENDKINEVIGKYFKGIDLEKKYLFYKAMNGIPDGKTPLPSYGFVKELR
ncbi:hypothetical protein SDC9_57257 [bioreactor metagenome]|uniref:Uncharacterized protein n=1 Tax=bioreactor metagenome TaxID=1076179 RepID=A0A644X425_9ZZZZ